MNVKFHKNCENTGTILKTSCFRCNFVKFLHLSPLKNVKKNAICFKLFWYKVFVHWKLELLNFLVDSVLISVGTIYIGEV